MPRVSTQTTTYTPPLAMDSQYLIVDMENVRRTLCSWSHLNVSACFVSNKISRVIITLHSVSEDCLTLKQGTVSGTLIANSTANCTVDALPDYT